MKTPKRRARVARTLKTTNDASAAASAFKIKTDEPAAVLVVFRIEEKRWKRREHVSLAWEEFGETC